MVTSSFGAMFAPDHRAVAGELLRVCRPGGTIGMLNFTPEGLAGGFLRVFASYMPPPPEGAPSPLMWGSEAYVRDLFGERVATLELARRTYVERAPSPARYCDLVKDTFGPVIAVYADLAHEPDCVAALDREFLAFVSGVSRGAREGPAELHYEYLQVIARTPDRAPRPGSGR